MKMEYMEFNEELDVVNQISFMLSDIENRLDIIKVQVPPELKKAKNILMNKEVSSFHKIRNILYQCFRRLDEMGIDDDNLNKLSSELYLLVKSHGFFDTN